MAEIEEKIKAKEEKEEGDLPDLPDDEEDFDIKLLDLGEEDS